MRPEIADLIRPIYAKRVRLGDAQVLLQRQV